VAFENLRGVLKHAADAPSSVRLALAAGFSSRASARPAAGFLLRRLSAHDRIDFRYRQHGRVLSAALRMAALQSDLLGFYEVVVYDCYRVPSWFHPLTVIDGGANVGFFTLSAATRWPGAKVIAVEPLPENADLIERNLAANGLNAEIIRAALSAKAGTTQFYIRDPNAGSLYREDRTFSDNIEVALVRLSDIYGTTTGVPCLLKLDIEGSEVEVLEEFLAKPRGECVFVGELHRWPETHARFEGVLNRAGFRVEYYNRDRVCVLFTAYRTESGDIGRKQANSRMLP
jgi:FkbM family methyltransferase